MIQFKKKILSNGLTVIAHEDFTTPMAVVNVLYDVGARDEDAEKTGFAHLFEHLMFGGSVNIPNYDEPLQRVGGENNAFTNNDITNYYCVLPADNIETALWLESDRMLSLAFTEKSLEVQRSVVIEEFKQRYLNQPYGDEWLLLRPLAYEVHPYRWATIGKDISHIENATMDDVKRFFRKFYYPANAILVIAGNITSSKVFELAEKWFGDIPASIKPERNLPPEPQQNRARKLVIEKDVPAHSIHKVYHMVERSHDLYHTQDLISDVLGRGHSSRLFQSLVKEQQLFSEASAYVTGSLDKGLLVISGKVSKDVDAETAHDAMQQTIQHFLDNGLNEGELEKVKNKAESTIIISEISLMNRALALAFSELLGDPELVNKEKDKIQSVTEAQLLSEAHELLRESNCSTLFYLSKNKK
jgi:predicted Zn-dependent peptidase